MEKSVKDTGMTFKALLVSGALAGAIGLGYAGGDKQKEGSKGASAPAAQEEDLGVGGSVGPGASAAAALPPNVAPGWKIRVCSEKTKAQSISFRISDASQKQDKHSKAGEGTGTGGSSGPTMNQSAGMAGQEMATWSQGDPSVITIPDTFSKVEKLKIEAIPGQDKMKTSACVLYNDHVTKKIEFDSRKEYTVKMDESSTCGC
ncbi:MAG TPA: hypothetical protein VK465_13730 [Fibrobacteria bacterium]|nr:hypothetical protein [Fibrobacteria bacterium]